MLSGMGRSEIDSDEASKLKPDREVEKKRRS